MSWFDTAVQSVSGAATGLVHSVEDTVGSGVNAVTNAAQTGINQFSGGYSGPDTHDAATARGGTALQGGETSILGRLGQTVGDFTRGISQEGLGGLLDPAGMMDRQDAQRDLSSRFQVVGDDFVGPRNHNQVTQEEYQNIAHTFSDVRTGRGDLTLDTSAITDPAQAQTYRDGTMVAIADMMMTTSGRQQINNLSNNVMRDDAGNARHGLPGGDPMTLPFGMEQFLPETHRHTSIRPLFNDTNNNNNLTDDAHTSADYFNGNAFADARGAQGENGAIDTSGRGKWSRDPVTNARGLGTDSTIWWNPTASVGNCNRSDVILAHEMQHSLHETQGTMGRGTYTDPAGLDPDSGSIRNFERQAVGLSRSDTPTGGHYPGDPDGCTENTYRSERNQLGLGDNFAQRTNYSGTMPGMNP